jgi:hypothetical protein
MTIQDENTNPNPQTGALEKLIKDLGIDTLSKEKQDDLIIKMTEVLLKRIFLETMDKLGEKGREEYDKITQDGMEPAQVEAFFKERISNYDEMVQKVVEEFEGEMMQARSSIQQVIGNQEEMGS